MFAFPEHLCYNVVAQVYFVRNNEKNEIKSVNNAEMRKVYEAYYPHSAKDL